MSQFDTEDFKRHLMAYLPEALIQQSRCIILEEVDSTHDYLKRQAENLDYDYYVVCIADQQSHGRGRQGKIWHSPKQCNLYLSLAYPYDRTIPSRPLFSLVASLSVAQALSQIVEPLTIGVKWPNDLVYENQKLAGLLVELQRTTWSHNWLIIGVGVNVNFCGDSETLDQPWTSLALLSNTKYDRAWVASNIVKNLIFKLEQMINEGTAPFLNQWPEYDVLRYRDLQIKYEQRVYQGEAVGIDRYGRLLLFTPQKETLAFDGGDISYI